MPRTKLHKTAERHRASRKAKTQKGASVATTHALDVNKIDWSSFVNPFILPEGVSLYE